MNAYQHFQTYNPFRTPSWRADRVLELVQARPEPLKCSRKRDDEYVREYRNFLLKYFKFETDAEQFSLYPKNPGLFLANMIHYHPDTEWRAIIQARLLARLSDKKCAAECRTTPDAILWYERLFFNIRDRIDAHDWIVKSVLGTAAYRAASREGNLTENQRDLTYKLFAYFGGPLIFDIILAGFQDGNLPRRKDQCDQWFESTFARLITERATQHARVFEVNKFNVMQLMEITCGIISSAKAERQGQGPQSEVEKNVEAMLQKLPWGLATRKEDQRVLTAQQREFSVTAVEPRAEEQFMLAMGHVPESLVRDREEMGQQVLTVTADEE